MATVFHYGPYASISTFGLPPGGEENWWFGPWPWYADAVTITAHPLALAGADRKMEVTNIRSGASPNGDRFMYLHGPQCRRRFRELRRLDRRRRLIASTGGPNHEGNGDPRCAGQHLAHLAGPAKAPMGGTAAPAGHSVTEVDIAGAKLDLDDPKGLEAVMDAIRNYRVETKTSAKLVRKRGAKSG